MCEINSVDQYRRQYNTTGVRIESGELLSVDRVVPFSLAWRLSSAAPIQRGYSGHPYCCSHDEDTDRFAWVIRTLYSQTQNVRLTG